MADNDDLMLEVTASTDKADSSLQKLFGTIDAFQARIDKVCPSLSKFTEKLNDITSSSKGFAMLDRMTRSTTNFAGATQRSDEEVARHNARMETYTAQMERAKAQQDRTALSALKTEKGFEALATAEQKAANSADSPAFQKFLNTPQEGFTEPESQPVSPSFRASNQRSQDEASAFWANVSAKVDAATPKINVNTDAATAEIRKVGEYIDSLTPKISTMSEAAQAQFNAIASKLTLVSQRLDNQRMLYRSLADQAAHVAEAQGSGSTAYLQLEKRMLTADAAAQKLSSTQEKLQAELADVTTETSKVGAGMAAAGSKSESAAKKSRSAWEDTLRMMEKMFIRIAAFRIFSAFSQGITTGIQDMAQASGQANNTMSALATSSLYLKNSFASALMPAIQALTPAITWLSNELANLFNTIAMLTARIFNHSSTVTIAQRANVNYAQTIAGVGDKAKDTTAKVKELQRTVMGFDELNVLSKPASEGASPKAASGTKPGMPSTGSMFKTIQIPAGIQAMSDKIKALFAEWAKYAQPTAEAFQRLVKALEPLKTFAAKGITDFYNDFLKPVGKWTLGTGLPQFFNITSALVKSINWSTLNKSLDNLWKALTPFTIHVGGGLLWFYQYVISPIAKWAANNLAPAALNLLANAIKVVDSVTQALKPVGLWLYNNFLKPIGEWTGKVIISALGGVSTALAKISNWINNNQGAVRSITTAVLAFFAAWKGAELLEFIINAGGVIGILKQLGTAIWSVTGAKIADKAQTIALAALYAKDFVVSIVQGTAALAKQIAQWVALKAAKIADVVQTVAQTAATKLATLAQGALNIVMNANPIAIVIIAIAGLVTAFILLYNKCTWFRNGWNSVWGSISNGFKGFVNGIIYGLNGIIGGINFLINALDKIKIDVPSWVQGFGGKSFGINIPDVPKIPYLASGALLTKPTLFVGGDNPYSDEAVLPLNQNVFSRIAQGIQKNSGNGGTPDEALEILRSINESIKQGHSINIKMDVDGRPFVNKVITEIKNKDRCYHPVRQFQA